MKEKCNWKKEGREGGGASRRREVAREGIRGVYRRGRGWKEKGVLDKRGGKGSLIGRRRGEREDGDGGMDERVKE